MERSPTNRGRNGLGSRILVSLAGMFAGGTHHHAAPMPSVAVVKSREVPAFKQQSVNAMMDAWQSPAYPFWGLRRYAQANGFLRRIDTRRHYRKFRAVA